MNGSSSNEAAAEADQVPLHQTKRRGRKRKEEDPVERKKRKNENDRNRRAEKKRESQQLRDDNTKLKRENEELKSGRLNLENHVIERNPPLHGMMEFDTLKADNLEMKKKCYQMRVELQSMDTKLKERDSEITLWKTALQKLGKNITSFKELEEWIISLKYEQVGQGSGPNDTNVTAADAAGPSFVATLDHLPNNAAGILTAPTAGGSFDANYELPPAFDAPNINLGTHEPAAAGFSTPSAAGPSSAAWHFDFDNSSPFPDDDLVGLLLGEYPIFNAF